MKRTFLIVALSLVAFAAGAKGLKEQNRDTKQENILYIVDGVVTPKEKFDALQPEQVKNMNVVSGIDKAVVVTTMAKDATVNGKVIKISGKPQTTVITVDKSGEGSVVIDEKLNGTKMRVITVPDDPAKQQFDALIVIKRADGKIEVAEDYGQFEPSDIKAISVLKAEEACKQFSTYGDTSNGVILIELK